MRALLEDVSSNGQPLPTRVMLYLYAYDDALPLPALEYGMEICVRADTYLPSGVTNPLGYDYSAWLWKQGAALAASASVQDVTHLSEGGFSIMRLAAQTRAFLGDIVYRLYGEECAPLVSALLLGDRSMLPEDLQAQFSSAGLAHLLAISGLHISCLASALDWLLRKMRIPQGIVFPAVGTLLAFYALLVGGTVSILRAVIMYMFSGLARLTGRAAHSPTILALTLAILLCVNPLWSNDASLILSFGSVAGILLLTRPLTPKRLVRVRGILHTPVRAVTLALCATLAAQIATLPALAAFFGELPLYSLLANLPALPLLTLTLPFAMLSVLLGCISLSAGKIIAAAVEGALLLLISFTKWIASLPGALVHMPVWAAGMVIAYIVLCALASSLSCVRPGLKKLCLGLIPAVALCACLRPLTYPTENLEVLFLDAGQADAALIRAEDQYYVMDAGENGVMADYLSKSGIRPSGVFISHLHSDHALGLSDVIACCPPAVIYLPCLWDDVPADEGIPELIEEAIRAGWVIRTLEQGDRIALSDHVTAEVHQPWEGMTDDANGSSLVMSVSIGEGRVLFTGDLVTENEYAFLPDCDVLKIPHHGAKSSTSPLLLEMTSPSAAVIPVGHNSYGHPAEQTLNRLKEAGCAVYRTDLHGAVSALLTPDGTLKITPFIHQTESEAAS